MLTIQVKKFVLNYSITTTWSLCKIFCSNIPISESIVLYTYIYISLVVYLWCISNYLFICSNNFVNSLRIKWNILPSAMWNTHTHNLILEFIYNETNLSRILITDCDSFIADSIIVTTVNRCILTICL